MKHQLSLFNNAIDSLNESLALFHSAKENELRKYKFAVLNFCHFAELLFKHFVSEVTPNKVECKTKKEEIRTIDLWESLKILSENNLEIEPELRSHLKAIKKTRNEIEHYKFSFNIEEIEQVAGEILR